MRRTGFDTMSPFRYPLYICFHPKDGFQEMKANKKGSSLAATIIVVLWLFCEVFYRSATSYDMNNYMNEQTSLLRTAVITVIMYLMVCISNWCFCTLLDGKGRLPDICVVAAYALFPYVVMRFVTTLLSWVLAGDEQILLTYILGVAMAWCCIIAFIGLAEIHDYTYSKTFLAVILTILGVVIILFITMMVLTLFRQVYFFATTVIMELMY